MAKQNAQTILTNLRKAGTITNSDLLTPKGTCNWCVYKNASNNYNAYSLNFIDDGSDAFNTFVEGLEEIRDIYYDDLVKEEHTVKGKADIVTEKDGSRFIKIKIADNYDKEHSESAKAAGRNYIPVFNKEGQIKIFDKTGKEDLEFDALIGNGSVIRASFYPVPYYMASTKLVGVSLRLKTIQVIKLNEYKKDNSGFGDESDADDVFNTAPKTKIESNGFGNEDDLGDVF